MVHLEAFTSSTVAAFTQIAFKSTGIILIAAGVNGLLRRHTAALRHIVWTAALGAILFVALFGAALPAWHIIPVPQRLAPLVQADITPQPPAPIETAPAVTQHSAVTTGVQIEKPTTTARSTIEPEPVPMTTVAAPTPVAPASSRPSNWPLWLALLWMGGAVTMLARYLVASLRVRKLLLSSRRLLAQEWISLEQHVTSAFGISRPVTLFTSERVDVPITCGVVYPRVVLPAAADEWTVTRRHAVISHELAHVKRFDAATQWIAFLATIVCWFNPVVWYAVRQMRFERERACDDFVLASGARASEYASDLLAIVSSFGSSEKYHVALAMARRSQFEGRLLALLDPALDHKFVSRKTLAAVAAVAFAVVIPVAAAHLAQAPAAAEQASPAQVNATSPEPETAATSQPESAPQASSDVQNEASSPAPNTAPASVPAMAPPAPAAAPRSAPQGMNAPAPQATPSYSSQPAVAPAPAAPARPAATSVAAPPTQSFNSGQFAACENASHRNISQHEDGSSKRWDVSIRGNHCNVDMRAEGTVKFKPDFSGVESISPGGYLNIKTTINGESNELDVRPGAAGLVYAYSRNGSRVQMDATSQKWLGDFLAELDRSSAFAVDTRLPQLLAQGGPQRVLQETAHMGDYARSVYIAALMKNTQLSPADAREVVRQAGATGSDYYSAQMLMAIADRYSLDDPAIGGAFVQAIDHIGSDYYHAQVLMRFLDKSSTISKQQADVLLHSAARIGSDYYVSQVLQHMAEKKLISANGWPTYLEAAQKVGSDYYRCEVLRTLMQSYTGDSAIVERSLLAAEGIGSDYYKLQVLRSAKDRFKIEGRLLDAYMRVARTIQSETYRKEALAGFSTSGVL